MQESLIFADTKFGHCHASTIVETPQGLLMACLAGPAEGHSETGIWGASYNGEWRDQRQIIVSTPDNGSDNRKNLSLWNPVLFRNDDEIRLYYRTGTSPEDWHCSFVSAQPFCNWSGATLLPLPLIGPVRNKPVKLNMGDIIIPTSTETEAWSIHFEIFQERKNNWKKVTVPGNGLQAIQPVIIEHKNKTLQALCRTRNSYIAQTWSDDGGLSWSQLELTELINPNAAIDAIKCDRSGYLLVYNNCRFGRYKLSIATSADGHRWEDKLTLENSPGEYSYPCLEFSESGELHVLYTFNRKNIKHVEISRQEVLQLFDQSDSSKMNVL